MPVGHIAFKNATFPGSSGADLDTIAADSTDGGTPNWSVPTGAWDANGSGAILSTGVSVAVPNLAAPSDGNFDLDFVFSTAGDVSFYACNGNTEYYLLNFDGGTLTVTRNSASGAATLATFSVVTTSATTVKAAFRRSGGTGTVAITVNSTLLGTPTDSAPPTTAGATAATVVAITSAVTLSSLSVTLAPATTASWSGPTTSTTGSPSTVWAVTLNHPAGAGGIVVSLASNHGGDAFRATSGGSTVTSITIPDGSSTGNFYLVQAADGVSVVTPTATGVTFSPTTKSCTAAAALALAAGVATAGATSSSTAAATASDATGGITPYTYQWYRSTASGTLGSALSGKTTRNLADTGLTPSTTYYYTLRYTDAASSQANSNQVSATTAAPPAPASGDDLAAYYPAPSLETVYFVIRRGAQAWNGSAFEDRTSANWDDYMIPGVDAAGDGWYYAAHPATVPAGTVTISAYVGPGTPLDTFLGSQDTYWDGIGTALLGRSNVARDLTSDGTSPTASSGTRMYFAATDRIANAMTPGAIDPQIVSVVDGTGVGQLIPIATIGGSSGSRYGDVLDGYTIAIHLATNSQYRWMEAPATLLDSGSGDDWLDEVGGIKAGETNRQSFKKLYVTYCGEWERVSGVDHFKLDGEEIYHVAQPTSTGRDQVTDA